MHDEFITRLNLFFQSRQQSFDGFYFYWTSLAHVMSLGNRGAIDLNHALKKVMALYCEDQGYIEDMINPVLQNEISYQNYKRYMHFGYDLYDLGSLWRDIVLKQDQDGLEKLCVLLKEYLSLLTEDRQKVLQVLKKEHAHFQTTFFEQYLRSHTKAYKEYVSEVRYTIHTFMVSSELLELLKETE